MNPAPEQRRDHETETFEEGEVWGIDVLITSGSDGKAKTEESRTTIYKRDPKVNYQLKMQTSRKVFSEIQKKAGAFPFTLRTLEDEKRARMGVQEAVQHGEWARPGTSVSNGLADWRVCRMMMFFLSPLATL